MSPQYCYWTECIHGRRIHLLTLLTGHWNQSYWLPTLLPWLDELSSARVPLFLRPWAQSPVSYTHLYSSQAPDNMDCTDSISLKSTYKTVHSLWAIWLNRQCYEWEELLTPHCKQFTDNNIRVQNRVIKSEQFATLASCRWYWRQCCQWRLLMLLNFTVKRSENFWYE